MEIEMKPTPKPVPDRDVYSPVELELFPRLTRADYKARFGVQAPPFDMSRPVQRFFDTTADPLKPYTFLTLDKKQLRLASVTIPTAQALSPNLPGLYEYAKWAPEPSRVQIRVVGTGEILPHGSADNLLATREQVEAMRKEVGLCFMGLLTGGVTSEEATLNSSYQYVYPIDEPRRIWRLLVPLAHGATQPFNVGLLLQERYRLGVGAPGAWKLIEDSGGYSLVWDSAIGPTPDWNDLPETPIPMRTLWADEELFYQFGGNVGVRKKSTAPAVAGGFTDADRSLQQSISADVKAIRGRIAQVFGS